MTIYIQGGPPWTGRDKLYVMLRDSCTVYFGTQINFKKIKKDDEQDMPMN